MPPPFTVPFTRPLFRRHCLSGTVIPALPFPHRLLHIGFYASAFTPSLRPLCRLRLRHLRRMPRRPPWWNRPPLKLGRPSRLRRNRTQTPRLPRTSRLRKARRSGASRSWGSLRPPLRRWCWRPGSGAGSGEQDEDAPAEFPQARLFFTHSEAGLPDSSGAPPGPALPL